MRKNLFIVMFVLLMVPNMANAQEVRFGIEAGTGSNSAEGGAFADGFNILYNLGGRVEYSPRTLEKGLFFSSGLRLIDKYWKPDRYFLWDKPEDMVVGKSYRWDAYPTYLELPINIGYRFRLSHLFNINVEAGPWIGVGLWGESSFSVYERPDQNSGSAEDGKLYGKDGYRRFEVGVGGRVGLEFKKHWQLWVGYDYQLNSVRKGTDYRNQTFRISAAYMF